MATLNVEEVTAEALVDLPVPNDVRISPDSASVVYSLKPIARSGEHTLSSLWLADVGKEFSARQLTSGLFNDESPQWSPGPANTECIAFLSDRAKSGESSAIYMMSLRGGEPYPVTKVEDKKKIEQFKWSPNGQFIAFTSPDEKSEEQEAREKETGEAKVYGMDWEYNRLRCLHIATREISILFKANAHVTDFAWNDGGTEIACITQETPDINSPGYHGIRFERISIATGTHDTIGGDRFPGLARDLLWFDTDLFFLAGATPDKSNSSSTIYGMRVAAGKWSRYDIGTHECKVALRLTAGKILIHGQDGLFDKIFSIDGRNPSDMRSIFRGICELGPWVGMCPWDSIANGDEFTTVMAKSSGDSPTEIYSFASQDEFCQLSQHGQALAKHSIGDTREIYCKAKDGTGCDGIFMKPKNLPKESGPLPTAVLIHGGPYSRFTVQFNVLYYYWGTYLVSAGYAVLCPNYRGGSSHGEDYARQARGRMGREDYDDVIAMVKHGVSEGLIDETRVAIGGWSQGGFLSYLAVTRPDFHFKAAICGAGVSDWDMHTMSSDAGRFQAELTGIAPWETDANDTKGRHGSAIWHMKNVKTPILILHGEEDERVPINQAVAFHRGCLHYGVPCEFVAYPREGHFFQESKHMVDMLKRIRRFCDLHLRS